MTFIPLYVDVSTLKVLVIGGGKVGTKRALKLLDAGATVTVLSKDFTPQLLESRARLIKGDASGLDDNSLKEFDLIITATNDPHLNAELCKRSIALGKLCNNPTNPNSSNWILPIFYQDDQLGVAVTTFGKSSLTSELILDRIKREILDDPYIRDLAKVMAEVKKLLKSTIPEINIRYPIYNVIFNDDTFKSLLRKGEIELSIQRAKEIIDERRRSS